VWHEQAQAQVSKGSYGRDEGGFRLHSYKMATTAYRTDVDFRARSSIYAHAPIRLFLRKVHYHTG